MRATDERVRRPAGSSPSGFRRTWERSQSPSDIRLLVPSFELSLRSANKMAEDD